MPTAPNRFSNRVLITALLAGLLATVNTSHADEYEVDNSHTSVIFSISHFGYSYCYGRFNKVTGAFNVDDGNPAANSIDVTIDANSVDTNDEKRDDHLRGPDFFDSKQFPSITFKSESAEKIENGIRFKGKMTMHGETKDVSLDMQRLGTGKGPAGKDRTGYFLQKTIKRSEFGVNGYLGKIGDDVSITISFEGVKK